jgi:hypothetical protein
MELTMKALLAAAAVLIGVAVTPPPAFAQRNKPDYNLETSGGWEADCRRGWASTLIDRDSVEVVKLDINEDKFTLRLWTEELLALEKPIPGLKECRKFWQCLDDRDRGKPLRCDFDKHGKVWIKPRKKR